MNPLTLAFLFLGIVVLLGFFIVLFDKGLKWKDKPSGEETRGDS